MISLDFIPNNHKNIENIASRFKSIFRLENKNHRDNCVQSKQNHRNETTHLNILKSGLQSVSPILTSVKSGEYVIGY